MIRASRKLQGLPRGLCAISRSMQGHCRSCADKLPSTPHTSGTHCRVCPVLGCDVATCMRAVAPPRPPGATFVLTEISFGGRMARKSAPGSVQDDPIHTESLPFRLVFCFLPSSPRTFWRIPPLLIQRSIGACGSPRLCRLYPHPPRLCTTATQSRLSTLRFEREPPRVCPPTL